jgi:DnaJ-class molecular chaperone
LDKYYSILGVTKTSTPEEIKKSYKKLAKIYHPDVSKKEINDKKFKEINEAYDFLIKQKHQSSQTKDNVSDYIYKNFNNLMSNIIKNEKFKNDIFIHIKISLKESINGTKIKYKHPNGYRYINIPSNIGMGEIIKVQKLGKINSIKPGDLYIKIYIKNDKNIKIDENNNITITKKICLLDYLENKNNYKIKVLDEEIDISKNINIFKNKKIKYKNKGLYFNSKKERGNLYLNIKIDFISATKKILKKIISNIKKKTI